jgi:hypothetical protein
MTDSNVFSREPYRSGNSEVVTVSGIPGISNKKKVRFKQVEIEGEIIATLCVPYDEIPEHQLEDIDELLLKNKRG